MTISGPTYTSASENLALATRIVDQQFRVSGGNRGLESVTARLWRQSNVWTPNLILNSNFATDAFSLSGPQVWEAWGGPKASWAAGFVQFAASPGTYPFLATKLIRTQVKNRGGSNLTLHAGDAVTLVVSVTSDQAVNFLVRAYSGDGQVMTQTFLLPADSVSHDYTVTGTASRWWRDVRLELASGSSVGSIKLTNVSFKVQSQLTSPVRCSIYTDDDGLPGLRVAQSDTTYNPHADLTTSPADYSFVFNDPPLLVDGDLYHMVVYVDAPDTANWFDDTSNGHMVWAIWDSAGATYPDGEYAEWVYGNTAGVWTNTSGADLYFAIFYSDDVPAAPDYPLDIAWPCDCNAQISIVDNMVQTLENELETLSDGIQPLLEQNVISEPGIGLWGTRWIQEGGSLPLPDWMNLLWRSKGEDRFGGQFTSHDGAIARVESPDWVRSSYQFDNVLNSTDNTFTTTNVNTSRNKFNWNLSVEYPSYLYFQFQFFFEMFGATGDLRWTYWINGVNQFDVEIGAVSTPQTNAGYDFTPTPTGLALSVAKEYRRKVFHPFILQPGLYGFELTFWTPAAGSANSLKAGPTVADGVHSAAQTALIVELIRV